MDVYKLRCNIKVRGTCTEMNFDRYRAGYHEIFL